MADTNYTRFAYRLTGGYIDNNAIAMGSSNAATTTHLGTVEVAHGMNCTPYVAFTKIISPLTVVTGHSRKVGIASGGLGAAYITFVTGSMLWTSAGETYCASVCGNGVTVNFMWCAMRSNQ